MELFTSLSGFTDVLLRWLHIIAGITWIGLLYYFNFVQAPFMNEVDADVKGVATRTLVPRALFWFRWAALVTWVVGAVILVIRVVQGYPLGGTYGALILSGGLLGTYMFLNVWGVIWRNQKVVIGSAEAVAGGGQALGGAADAARRALLASRTNVLFSIPMLFFMVLAPHGAGLVGTASASQLVPYWIVFWALTLAIEVNALVGLTGAAKRPLEKPGITVLTGIILFAVLYGTLVAVAG
jgi:uncharacterized membrane protein